MTTGTFSSSADSPDGAIPWTALGQQGWESDYYKTPTLASSWSIVSFDNGNGTFTWNITAFYAGLTVPFIPTPTVSTPYTWTDTYADAGNSVSCTGRHVATAGQPPEDIETCLWSGNLSGMTAGNFSSSADSPDGAIPWTALGQQGWESDYYSAPVDATSWSIVSIDNGNGAFTWSITAYYNGLSS